MRILAAVALLVLGSDPVPADLDRRMLEALKGTREAGAVLVHFDPATVPAAAAEAEAVRAREALASLEKRLETRWEGTAHVFLYADLADFRARTGAPSAWEGFASGTASLHVPRGAPLRHEFTHLLARRFPGPAGRATEGAAAAPTAGAAAAPAAAADPGGLLREGLAVAMEGTDRGVPASSFAAVYARLGLLPRLADLRDRWPEGPPREFNPYHAAGSFVEGLLATDGLAKVKAMYSEPARTAEILGRGWDALEEEWLARLAALVVPDAEEDAVRREYLLPTAKVPQALAGSAGVPLFEEGAALAAGWTREGGLLRGTGRDGWSLLGTEREWAGEFALRVVVRIAAVRGSGTGTGTGAGPGTGVGPGAAPGPGAGLLLRINRAEGRSDEALLTPECVGVTLRGGFEGLSRAAVRLVPGRWTEVVLAQEKGTARLYLDGRLVVEAAGAFGPGGGTAAVGVSGGSVEIRSADVVLPGKQSPGERSPAEAPPAEPPSEKPSPEKPPPAK